MGADLEPAEGRGDPAEASGAAGAPPESAPPRHAADGADALGKAAALCGAAALVAFVVLRLALWDDRRTPAGLCLGFSGLVLAVAAVLLRGYANAIRARRQEARVALARGDSGEYLVRWTYDPAPWRRWVRAEPGRWMRLWLILLGPALAAAAAGVAGVANVADASRQHDRLALSVGLVCFGGGLALTAIAYALYYAAQCRRLPRDPPYVCFVARDLVCRHGELLPLSGEFRELIEAEYVPAGRPDTPASLRFTVRTLPTSKASGVSSLTLPVPPGREALAGQVLEVLRRHHERGEG